MTYSNLFKISFAIAIASLFAGAVIDPDKPVRESWFFWSFFAFILFSFFCLWKSLPKIDLDR